ncbi:hypothetical protein AGLY_000371, partial [Aphis glycines]
CSRKSSTLIVLKTSHLGHTKCRPFEDIPPSLSFVLKISFIIFCLLGVPRHLLTIVNDVDSIGIPLQLGGTSLVSILSKATLSSLFSNLHIGHLNILDILWTFKICDVISFSILKKNVQKIEMTNTCYLIPALLPTSKYVFIASNELAERFIILSDISSDFPIESTGLTISLVSFFMCIQILDRTFVLYVHNEQLIGSENICDLGMLSIVLGEKYRFFIFSLIIEELTEERFLFKLVLLCLFCRGIKELTKLYFVLFGCFSILLSHEISLQFTLFFCFLWSSLCSSLFQSVKLGCTVTKTKFFHMMYDSALRWYNIQIA